MKTFNVVPSSPPQVQQGPKLVGEGAVGGAVQGLGVAISADGQTVLVGGHNDNNAIGAAWVWVLDGTQWRQQGGKLVGDDHDGPSQQGRGVALNATGDLAVVGGYVDSTWVGGIWTYQRDASGFWRQIGPKLVCQEGKLGPALAISADGKTLVSTIGDRAAIVFSRETDRWLAPSYLIPDGADSLPSDLTVAISLDGKTVLLGAQHEGAAVGAAWVFAKGIDGKWSPGVKLLGAGAAGESRQGFSVSLSADGKTAIVGGFTDDNGRGAAWIFTKGTDGWRQQGDKLVVPSGSIADLHGSSVSLSADGDTALIGALGEDNYIGAVRIWRRIGENWSLYGTKIVAQGAAVNARFGERLALSADGSTVIVGSPGDGGGGQPAGAAWIFGPRLSTLPPPAIDDFTPASGAIGTVVTIKGRHFQDLVSVSISGVNALPISNDGNTLVVMVMPGATSGPLTVTTSGGTVTA